MATNGDIFKAKRVELGLTQEQLGEKLEMDQSSISAAELNRFTLSIRKAKKFGVLGSFDWRELYMGEGEEVVTR